MIDGALILLVGILIGYSINFWYYPTTQVGRTLQDKVNNLLKNKKGIIVDMTLPVDLGTHYDIEKE